MAKRIIKTLAAGALSIVVPQTFDMQQPGADATGAQTTALYALPVLPSGSAAAPVDDRFDGGSVLHDNAAIAAAFNAKGRKVPLDVGHLTEYDGTAPAVGWVQSLFVAADGSLWAWCEMTADGQALVDGHKFGYTSPTLRGSSVTDSKDWQASTLKSLALTNNPALEMSATFTAEDGDDEDDIEAVAPATEQPAETLAATAAGTTADTSAQFAALTDRVAQLTSERDAARSDITTLTVQLTALTAERDAAKAELATFAAQAADVDAVRAVDEHIRLFKGTPATRDQLLAYARRDLAGFKSFSAATPPMSFGVGVVVPDADTAENLPVVNETTAWLKKLGGDAMVGHYQAGLKASK